MTIFSLIPFHITIVLLNISQSEDRRGGGKKAYILRNVIQCTGNTMTIDTFILPVVLPLSCEYGSVHVKQQLFLEELKLSSVLSLTYGC